MKDNDGYRYIHELGISIQYTETNLTLKTILSIVLQTGMSFKIEFMWEYKDGAAYPGETGTITI